MDLLQFNLTPDQIFFNETQDIIVKLSRDDVQYETIKAVKLQQTEKAAPKLLKFVEKLGEEMEEMGRFRTVRAYQTVAHGLVTFCRNKNLTLAEINTTLLKGYEDFMRTEGKSMNTISFHLRNIRAIYNKALQEKAVSGMDKPLFKNLSTGIYQTTKRALTKDDIHRLSSLDTSGLSLLHYHALLYFLFCFHARGMSFVDLAFLRKSDIRGHEIVYRRRKTGRLLRLKITDSMQHIIDFFVCLHKYSPYIFPIIDYTEPNEYNQYCVALGRQNRLLKKIGERAGITKPLTTHMSRHSWATIAKRAEIPTAIISEALGHKDEKTTSVYLDSFDISVIYSISDKISDIVN